MLIRNSMNKAQIIYQESKDEIISINHIWGYKEK